MYLERSVRAKTHPLAHRVQCATRCGQNDCAYVLYSVAEFKIDKCRKDYSFVKDYRAGHRIFHVLVRSIYKEPRAYVP